MSPAHPLPSRSLVGVLRALVAASAVLPLPACDETAAEPEELLTGETEDPLRVEVRVSAAGDDVAGDGSTDHPFRTVRRALESIPGDAVDTRFVIDCTDSDTNPETGEREPEEVGTDGLDLPFVASNAPFTKVTSGSNAFSFEGALTIQATPRALATFEEQSKPRDGKVDAITGLRAIVAKGTAWGEDEWKGKLLVGSGRGQIGVISGNTESCGKGQPGCDEGDSWVEVTIAASATLTPPFTIAEPSCWLHNEDEKSGNPTLASRGMTGAVSLAGLRVTHENRLISALVLASAGNLTRTQASEIQGISVTGGNPLFHACRFVGDAPIPDFPSGHAYRRMARSHAAYTLQRSLIQDLEFGSSQGGGAATLSDTIVEGCSYLGENDIEAYDGPWNFKGVLVRDSPTHGFHGGGGSPHWLRNMRIDRSAGDAIHAEGSGDVVVTNVDGKANGGHGIRARNGAQVEIGMRTHVTGEEGDLAVGSLPTRSYDHFRSELPVDNEVNLTPGTGDASRVYQEETCCGVWSRFGAGDSHEFGAAHATRIDAAGNVVFAGRTASASLAFPGGPAMASRGGYDGFVGKLSSAGEHLWSTRLGGGANDFARAVDTDADGNVLVVGSYDGSVSLGGAALPTAGGYEAFVVKLDPDGNHLWSIGLASLGHDEAFDVAVDGAGDVLVVGAIDWSPYGTTGTPTLHKLSSATGELLWSAPLGAVGGAALFGVTVDPSGDVLLAGTFGNPSGGSIKLGEGGWLESPGVRRGFVARLGGADGAHVWSRSIENSNQSDLNAVAVSESGLAIVAGASRGPATIAGGPAVAVGGEYDFFVAGLDATTGAHVWSRAFGGAGYELAHDLALDDEGGVVVSGQLGSSGVSFGGSPLGFAPSPANLVVARYQVATGAHLASRSIGNSGDDVAFGVAVRPETGNVHLAGHTSGQLDFWNGLEADPGAPYGFFVANIGRLDP